MYRMNKTNKLHSSSCLTSFNEFSSDRFSVSTTFHEARLRQSRSFVPPACSNPLLDPEPMESISLILR
ncbi:hypothetical protein HanXRQr2_Chr15g0673241 [Helianthus annuus]|uniref:Uncharacterized protein n=1 Tax=Helianthus annuus TaxID=4232 RepID=A0A9K3DY79_HELAN|nr:hypothetical protein HanXRQr2_Chr15g0673241 [Helianthus annuus]